ncbi:MAG TPA: hypothetical protein DCE23_02835 [Firmicutes bacterium]|nr:hypothetical protein [Bacillota bacterium]
MNKTNLETILLSDNIVDEINNNLSTLLELIPEIKPMINFPQSHPHHHLDVWNHTLLALSKSKKDLTIRLSLLLHDIGKPHSYQDEEVRHFKNHANVSSIIAADILTRLEYPEDYITTICLLIKYHDTKITEEQITSNRDFYSILYQIQYCDALAHHPDKLEKRIAYLNSINELLEQKKLQKEKKD